jgi:predicted NBD/HSP70 family sugar kinase
VSRADLARLTGLQASTTSVIIGQLIEEGWVSPGILGHLPRGRRPTFVTLNDKHVSLAVDLRPEKATVGAVDINGKILSQTIVEFSSHIITKSEARKAIAKIVNIAQMLRVQFKGRVLEGVGVSVSGRVDQEAHRLIFSPNAPWSDMDLCNDLRKLLNTPIEMENAANASLFAERWFGKLGGVSNIVVVSVSEGIGTGILLDGRLVRGRESLAGEFGHMPFESTGPLCGCGNVGCWEVFASNRAALRYYKETVPDSELTSFRDLLDLAKSGDIRALRSIDRMASYLARGLAILAAGLAPEVIVIVGDCTALWPRICPIIESELIARSFTSRIPRVAPATDGDSARLLGAAALISYKALFRHTSFEQLHRVKLDRLGKHAS